MQNDFNQYLDTLKSEIGEHPIAEKVFTYAKSRGIEIKSFDILVKIIEQIDNENLSDPKSIIIISDIVEKLIKYNNTYIENKTKNISRGED